MIPELFHQEAKDYLDIQIPTFNAELETALKEDRLWSSPQFESLRQNFLAHFNFLGDQKAQWLFAKSFNDLFIAERNFVSCPLW